MKNLHLKRVQLLALLLLPLALAAAPARASGIGSGNNISDGPMGRAEVWVVCKGGGDVTVQVFMHTHVGYSWQIATGFLVVLYFRPSFDDPSKSEYGVLYATVIADIGLSNGDLEWNSPVLHVEPGTVVTASFSAYGLGTTSWMGLQYPITWLVPPITDSAICW